MLKRFLDIPATRRAQIAVTLALAQALINNQRVNRDLTQDVRYIIERECRWLNPSCPAARIEACYATLDSVIPG